MKNLITILSASILLLVSCTEPTIIPTPPDADASSARKNYFKFDYNEKRLAPSVLKMKDANFYIFSDWTIFDKGNQFQFKVLIITDKKIQYFPYCACAGFDPADPYNYMISILLISAFNQPFQSGDFLIDKESDLNGDDWSPQIPTAIFHSHDYTNPWYYSTPNSGMAAYTHHFRMKFYPGYVNKDDYLNINGTVADGEKITITLNKADMMRGLITGGFEMYTAEELKDELKLGQTSFNFTGILDGSITDKGTFYSGRTSGNVPYFLDKNPFSIPKLRR